MANIKISQLTSATTPLTGAELVEVVQAGSSYQTTAKAVGNSADALPFASLAGRAYGSFCDVTDQTGVVAAGTGVKFGTDLITGAGISVAVDGGGNKTRLTFAAAGTYMVAPSLQFHNTDAADQDIRIWLVKNGTNIDNSATSITVPKIGDGGNGFFQLVFYVTVTAGQYVEVFWAPANVSVTIEYTAAAAGPPSVPAIPSAIIVAERIA